jgi:hypothetical protein
MRNWMRTWERRLPIISRRGSLSRSNQEEILRKDVPTKWERNTIRLQPLNHKVISVQPNPLARRTTQTINTSTKVAFKREWSYDRVCSGNESHKSSTPRGDSNPDSPRVGRKLFVLGEPLLWPELVEMLPTRMHELHKWYLKASVDGDVMFAARVKHNDLYRGLADVWIEFVSLWFLYHQDTLDKSLTSAFVT